MRPGVCGASWPDTVCTDVARVDAVDSPDFIVPPPGLIPAARPTDEPERTVQDAPRRALPSFSPPPGLLPPAAPPIPTEVPTNPVERIEAPAPQAAAGAWRLRAPGGLEVLLVRPAVLGRDPVADPTGPDATAVPLADPARSVSKTHARVEVVDGRVRVTDLASTNGTRVLTAAGESHELEPGRAVDAPNGATLLLGEFAVRLDRAPLDTV